MAISPLVDNVTSSELAVLCLALYIDRLANSSVQRNDILSKACFVKLRDL